MKTGETRGVTGLLVIDMQVGLFASGERHDAEGVIQRINGLARAVRDLPPVFGPLLKLV